MIAVSDTLSNTPEQIEAAADSIGRSKQRKVVFEAIYHGKKEIKTAAEIAVSTGLAEKAVLMAGKHLADHNVVVPTKVRGRTAYKKIGFFHKNKAKILSQAGNPAKKAAIATKRRPISIINPVSFVKPSRMTRSKKSSGNRDNSNNNDLVKIAFLISNPDDEDKLRGDIELRAVNTAILKSGNRDKISLRPYPAATFGDLLDALNEFKPHVVHFSGHGGSNGIVFDNEYHSTLGGSHLQFRTIAKVLKSLDFPPTLITFNACDTVDGAAPLLSSVKAVVAMSDSILDESALIFAPRFYAALVSGSSVGNALDQASASLAALGYPDSDLPTILTADGIDPYQIKLI